MLTPQDVRSVQFEKNLRGYRTEDVDRFLDKVEEQLQQNDAQAEQLRKQIADLTAENQKLKGELQSFEADGDMLKSALINAQRMGENVIREATRRLRRSFTAQICGAMISSAMPTSCCRRQATAQTRSRTRPTRSVWLKSGSTTASVWRSPASRRMCSICTAAMWSL